MKTIIPPNPKMFVMKKLITLIWLTLSAFSFKAAAQSTTCNAEFSWQYLTSNTVKFTPAVNDSPDVHHYWTFGDGSPNVPQVSPTHTYIATGTYVVVHSVYRVGINGTAVCTQSITHTIIIQSVPTPCNLVVDFNWTSAAGNPLTFAFQNLSTPLAATDSISWTFGDGSSSHDVNPVHTYTNAGTYTVCLVVKKNNTTPGTSPCIRYLCKTVVVQTPCNLVVDFNWTVTATNPLMYEFHNLSIPLAATDSISWTFGDGSSSHDVNPVHTYANAGTYNVCLVVKKYPNSTAAPCVRYICKTVVVQTPCNLVVDFSWNTTNSNPLTIEFHNLSTPLSSTDSISWTFGDGTSSSVVNPVHTYTAAGSYTVCLRVKKVTPLGATPCVREICKTVVVQTPCTLVVDFSWTNAQTNPLMYEFHNLSIPLSPTDSTIWTFGDGTTSYVANPTHTYANAGTYNVCLIVKKYPSPTAAPCVRYICKTVVVQAPCNLVADFSWTIAQTNPLLYEFHNLSTPLAPTDSTIWNFGDGSGSTAVSPNHTYANAGTYNVCLIVKRYTAGTTAPCVRYICKTIIVQAPCTLVADFNWTVTQTNPLMFEFHNLSTPLSPTDSTIWSFGDGSGSTAVNPVHTYTHGGTYTVCLTVKKYPGINSAPCVRYICKTIIVQEPCNLVAGFSWHADPNNSQHIYFTNNSTPLNNIDSTRWSFGDGTYSNAVSPDHSYVQPGTYTVCLRIQKFNTAGTAPCVREFCSTVVVQPGCNLQVNWSWRLDSANVKKVYFTNLTTPVATNANVTWSFGDGATANTWNAVHEYAQPGRYYVCLRIQLNNTCIRYKCDSITVPVPGPPCTSQSNFTSIVASTNNQTLTFVPAYQNAAAVYTWTFGDGSSSHDMIATHHYAQGGSYNVCLTVWRSSTCASTTCRVIQVAPQFNCDSIHVSYTYQFDAYAHNKVYFYANANYPILDQTWTIKRLPNGSPVTLHQNNPSYIFQDTGYYSVCLRAVTLGGCIKEYCSTIHITQIGGGTNACTLSIYPNPASSVIILSVALTAPEMINVYVYNTMNVLVMEKHQQGVVGNNSVTLNVANLVAGMYTMKVVYGNHICYAQFQKL